MQGHVALRKSCTKGLLIPGEQGRRTWSEKLNMSAALCQNCAILTLCNFLVSASLTRVLFQSWWWSVSKQAWKPFWHKRAVSASTQRSMSSSMWLLVYLHSHSPLIVHRDLTARNVLLTNTMLAKIADLGNSRIIESNALSKTLSTVPGTLVYMPPEAMANPPQYNEKLDIFSFGHLALYTALQDFPCELLLGVYNDPKNPNRACARNEVERRVQYVRKLKAKFGANHTFTKLVNECLHNHPQIRPSAVEVLQQLQKLQKDHGSGSMRFSLSDYLHDLPEERVQYRHHPTVQHSLERIQVNLATPISPFVSRSTCMKS